MRKFLIFCLLAAAPWTQAADRPVSVIVDASVYRINPAMSGLPFQNLPDGQQERVWNDPSRAGGGVLMPVLAGGAVMVMSYDPRPAWRMEAVAPLLEATASDLRPSFDQALATQLQRHGFHRQTFHVGERASSGYLRRLGDRGDVLGLIVERDRELPVLSLGWDDRQVLMAATLRAYKRSRSKRGLEREQHARTVRYVGAALRDPNPLEVWSTDGAARFRRELERGWSLLLDAGLAFDQPLPSVAESESVTLQVAGQAQRFRGRLLRQDGVTAYLVDDDERITIVALGQ